jgi:cellobiose phosphorylase
LLSRYILFHHEDNSDDILAVKEDHHPDENHWIASSPYYNHSTFIDNVISGLLGIQPTINGIKITPLIPDEWEYFCIENLNIKSHDYLVFYDKYGTVYNKGVGFNIFRDGERILSKEKVCAVEISF